MTIIAGLPAHVLLVHAIVVLAPLTAALEMLCGVWADARRQLVWLVLALAVGTTVLTPLTTAAGEWLLSRRPSPSEVLLTHAERGEWMIYFSAALLVVAVALVLLNWLEGRDEQRRTGARMIVAILALAVGVSVTIGVVLIGDSGARSVWGGTVTAD